MKATENFQVRTWRAKSQRERKYREVSPPLALLFPLMPLPVLNWQPTSQEAGESFGQSYRTKMMKIGDQGPLMRKCPEKHLRLLFGMVRCYTGPPMKHTFPYLCLWVVLFTLALGLAMWFVVINVTLVKVSQTDLISTCSPGFALLEFSLLETSLHA